MRFLSASLFALVAGPLLLATGAQAQNESYERQRLAAELLTHPRVDALDYHVSGRRDSASAQDNLEQAASGGMVRRSSYGNAPGGWTQLDVRMLRALLTLANEGYSFRITEIAGGSHSSTSRHYSGLAFDVDMVNGHRVRNRHASYRSFIARCKQLGATQVFGPGTRGHSSHLHIAWGRR
jgi:hypothetical protein